MKRTELERPVSRLEQGNPKGNGRAIPRLDEKISRAVDWFYATWLDNESGQGWSPYEGMERVTEWGGTLDGVRALLEAGQSPHTPKIVKSVNWLKTRQQPDGGWLSWEIRQSCVEVTSWVLITLDMAGELPTSVTIEGGIHFLEDAQDANGGWGSYKGAGVRTYPTLLATWVLGGLNDVAAEHGARWLESGVNDDGGWGFHHRDGLSNTAMTAMALFVLLRTSKPLDKDIRDDAVAWLKRRCGPDRLWQPEFEDWINYEDPGSHEQFRTRTNHYSSAWAIISLIEAGESILEPPLFDAIAVLASTQQPSGSWIFVPYDANRHIWCAANALWALVEAKHAIFAPSTYYQSVLDLEAEVRTAQVSFRRLKFLAVVNLAATLGLIMYLSGGLTAILGPLSRSLSWLLARIAENIVPLLVATASTIVGGYIVSRLTSRRARNSIDRPDNMSS